MRKRTRTLRVFKWISLTAAAIVAVGWIQGLRSDRALSLQYSLGAVMLEPAAIWPSSRLTPYELKWWVILPYWMVFAAMLSAAAFFWHRDRPHPSGCCAVCGAPRVEGPSSRCGACGAILRPKAD